MAADRAKSPKRQPKGKTPTDWGKVMQFVPDFKGQSVENQLMGLKTPEAVSEARDAVQKKYPRPAGGHGFVGINQVD